MKIKTSKGGYTIIEVMIFLAVSGVLLVSAMATISGQQQRTEFQTSVRELETRLQDILNNLETGFYPTNTNFSCDNSGGLPDITIPGANDQGTNENCTFAGNAIQFSPAGEQGRFNIYTIAGLRVAGSPPSEVKSIDEANPVALQNDVEFDNLSSGLEFTRVVVGGSSTEGGFALLPSFGRSYQAGTALPGLTNVSLARVPGSTINQTATNFASSVSNIDSGSITQVADEITICIQEGGGGRRAALVLGGRVSGVEARFDVPAGVCP